MKGDKRRREFMEHLASRLVIPEPPDAENGLLEDEEDEGRDAYLAVRIGTETLAIPVTVVEEVIMVPELTPVPRAPAPILGVFLYRGTLIPMLDAAALLESEPEHPPARAVVMLYEGHPMALAVTESLAVRTILPEEWQPAPSGEYRFVQKTHREGDELMGLLDLEQVHQSARRVGAAS